MSKPYVICFAGVPGCGKSSVSEYLGEVFGLPRFERDKIRNEVRIDMGEADINKPEVLEEFNSRAESRLGAMLEKKESFILDSSVDRRWGSFKKELEDRGFEWFLMSFDMSLDWVKSTYERTNDPSLGLEEHYYAQHESFAEEYGIDVDLVVDDESILERNSLAEASVRDFLQTI